MPDPSPSIEERVSIIEARTLKMCDLVTYLARIVATQTGVDGERRWIAQNLRALWEDYHKESL